MAITPGGRVGDASPLAKPGYTGGRRLDDYVRMVAHAFIRKGMAEDHAIAAARVALAKWARGEGNVTPKVRAAAAAALAHQKILDQKGHLDMSTNELETSGPTINRNVDIRTLDLSTVATDDASPSPAGATDLDLAPGDYRPPYDWKHGYIPLTPAAARSKAKLGGKSGHAKPPKGRKIVPGKTSSATRGTFNKGPKSANSSNPPVNKPALSRNADVRGIQERIEQRTGTRPTAEQARAALSHAMRVESDKPTRRSSTTPGNAAAFEVPAAQKIRNAAAMHGTGSKQHKAAQARFGAQAQAEDDAARGRGVPGAVEAATPKPRKRAAVKTGPGMATTSTTTGDFPATRSEAAGQRAAANESRTRLALEAKVRRANAGDLDPALHSELRRDGMLDADNHPTAKGKKAGLNPALEREAAMRANHKPGDMTPPPDRSPEAQVRGLLRAARTPGLSERDRALKTQEAEKLAKKHKLDAAALDEQERQSMYEYVSGKGFVLKADGLTEADKIRAAGNHRQQAETLRARGDHDAAAHHEAEAAKYEPAGSKTKADYPVGARVKAGVAGNDSEVSGVVKGHTDNGMLRVEYEDRHGKKVTGTFNPSQARSLDKVTSDRIRERSGRDAVPGSLGEAHTAHTAGVDQRSKDRQAAATQNLSDAGDKMAANSFRQALDKKLIYPAAGSDPDRIEGSFPVLKALADRGLLERRYVGSSAQHDDHYVLTDKGKAARDLGGDRKAGGDLSSKSYDQLKRALGQHKTAGRADAVAAHEAEMRKRREAGTGPRVNVGGKMVPSNHPDALARESQAHAEGKGTFNKGTGSANSSEPAGISPATASKMSDSQLEDAVRRLMASGTYSGPALKVLEDELDKRDKRRAGKA